MGVKQGGQPCFNNDRNSQTASFILKYNVFLKITKNNIGNKNRLI